jgi:3-methylcrotonyl-CoA carboxylase alpha subunit
VTVHCHGADHTVTVEQRGGDYLIGYGDRETLVNGSLEGDVLHMDVQGHRQRATLARTADGYTLYLASGACHFHEVLPDTGETETGGADAGLTAPMNGTIVTLLVDPGTAVEADTPLLVMEAMKMEHTLRAPAAGTVAGFFFAAGDLVDGGAELVDFAPEGDD